MSSHRAFVEFSSASVISHLSAHNLSGDPHVAIVATSAVAAIRWLASRPACSVVGRSLRWRCAADRGALAIPVSGEGGTSGAGEDGAVNANGGRNRCSVRRWRRLRCGSASSSYFGQFGGDFGQSRSQASLSASQGRDGHSCAGASSPRLQVSVSSWQACPRAEEVTPDVQRDIRDRYDPSPLCEWSPLYMLWFFWHRMPSTDQVCRHISLQDECSHHGGAVAWDAIALATQYCRREAPSKAQAVEAPGRA